MLFIALQAYILRHLIKLELFDLQDPHIIRNSCIGVACYVAGSGAAWLSVHLAFIA